MYACIQYIQVNIQEMCKINLPTTVYIIKNRLTLHAICGFISFRQSPTFMDIVRSRVKYENRHKMLSVEKLRNILLDENWCRI